MPGSCWELLCKAAACSGGLQDPAPAAPRPLQAEQTEAQGGDGHPVLHGDGGRKV